MSCHLEAVPLRALGQVDLPVGHEVALALEGQILQVHLRPALSRGAIQLLPSLCAARRSSQECANALCLASKGVWPSSRQIDHHQMLQQFRHDSAVITTPEESECLQKTPCLQHRPA